ncbi:hypothetical protein D3C76_1573270 [compost metagenome]
MIAKVASDGLAIGRTMREKMRKWPAPSINAASEISAGTERKNCRIINTPKIVNMPGKISAQCVLNIPTQSNMMNLGTNSTCGGTIIIDR